MDSRFFRMIGPIVSMGIRNLLLHKLRSILTVSGLVFGVASVIVMLSVAEGASIAAQRQIADLGATNIILRSKKPQQEKVSGKSEEQFILVYGLTHEDLERIRETVPTVKDAVPLREFRQDIRYLDRRVEGRVVGATPAYLSMNGLKMREGRFLSDLDLDQTGNVCVLAAEAVDRLFPYEDPIGRSVRLGKSHFYRVIGVTERKAPSAGSGSSLAAQDFNTDAYIPITTDRARFGEIIVYDTTGSFAAERIQLSQITVAVGDISEVRGTASVLESMLASFHPKQDYAVTVPLELIEKAEATKRIFSIVLGSIAGISLLVGGIGIMNIMLATVTERTREIGIRRALGARRSDITIQFLVETAVLSATGAGLGVALGLLMPRVVSSLSGMDAILVHWAPFVAFFLAVSVGVLFGVFPARRAAFLDPIEALRAE